MDIKIAKDQVSVLKSQRDVLFVAASLLLIAMLMTVLGWIYVLNRQEKIIVPAVIEKPLYYKSGLVTNSYLEEMSIFFTQLRFNVTPDSTVYVHNKIREYLLPRTYQQIKKALDDESRFLKNESLSTEFSLRSVKTNITNMSALVTGRLSVRTGNQVKHSQDIEVYIQFAKGVDGIKIRQFKRIGDEE